MKKQQVKITRPSNISRFKGGDIITRLIPGGHNGTDGSWRGEPMEFLGIKNNMIYLKHKDGMFKNSPSTLEVERWQDGWGKWYDPKKLIKDCKQD
jgi:hypothetical protein